MLGVGSGGDAQAVYVGGTLATEVYFGGVRVWPDKLSELFTFSYTGNNSYSEESWTVPAGAKRVDLIVCGSGGGGSNGTLLLGQGVGGSAGRWANIVLAVGTHIAAGSTVKFVIGRGGSGGGALNIPTDGFNSRADYTRLTNSYYPVGSGGKALASAGATGGSAGNLTLNGYTYTGGVGGSNNGTGPGSAGGVPGGGGGGGGQQAITQLGGDGGHGECYARVYY
jgi:hypothetical protein